MLIKKHNNKNDYCLSRSGHWVRDFTKPVIKAVDINDMMPLEDMKLILANELSNSLKSYQSIEHEDFKHEKIVIIGDGYGFVDSLKMLEDLPKDVTVIGVNGIFAKWDINRRLNYYVVNNPYHDCLYNYPQIIKAWPRCIASTRTYPHFLEVYQGPLHIYTPVNNEVYQGVKKDAHYYIDDYRNPVCAAIILAHRFKAKKILLTSTLEMYDKERPGTDVTEKGLWVYPQQKIAQYLIDANLYWLKNKTKIIVSCTDKEPDYEFATYINSTDMKRFFDG